MDIESNNQMTFQNFTDNIAPSENIWINEKYKVILLNGDIREDNHNCQTLASKDLQ